MNKGILALFGATLIILLMVSTLSGITEFRSDSSTAYYDNTTVAGQTSANVTLVLGVLDDELGNVTSISSNITTDAPLSYLYTAATKYLLVTGLDDDNTRRLTVIYRYPALSNYTGVDLVAKWWPLFLVFGVIGVVVAAIFRAFGDKE